MQKLIFAGITGKFTARKTLNSKAGFRSLKLWVILTFFEKVFKDE
jgi:hypothetical protein